MEEWRAKQGKLRQTPAYEMERVEEIVDDFLFQLDSLNSQDEVNCSFTLEETGQVYDLQVSASEYPLPVTESTLFGWSVKIWDFHQQQWIVLPEFFETEGAAYDQAELIMKSIDEGSKND
jgi:hypothetical protein